MRHQRGYIWKENGCWYGRWREDVIENGRVVRKQHSRKLAPYSDRYRGEKDVRPLLDAILRPINEGRTRPESTLTVVDYVTRYYLPHIEAELRPVWRRYLAPHVQRAILRDYRCVDATNLLRDIHAAHHVSRTTLRHCKTLLHAIFAHAKQQGVLDSINPVTGAGIPRAAQSPQPTLAAAPSEVAAMLSTLTGTSKAAVALIYFCGLRPGEARGARWQDYDAAKRRLHIRRSVWRTHVTAPKTAESIASVPVCETLATLLAHGKPHAVASSGYILAGPSGKPINLHNLAARVVKPALTKAGIPWHGWYALRRGLATLATSVESPLAAKGLLRPLEPGDNHTALRQRCAGRDAASRGED